MVSQSGYALLHFFSDAAYNLTGFNISYRSEVVHGRLRFLKRGPDPPIGVVFLYSSALFWFLPPLEIITHPLIRPPGGASSMLIK